MLTEACNYEEIRKFMKINKGVFSQGAGGGGGVLSFDFPFFKKGVR